MLAEWTAECGPDDPVLVVPWSDPASGARFVNLRAEPYDLAEVPEADAYPALRRALRALNAQGSAFLTAKCDAWTLYAEDGAEKLEALRLELDVADEEVAFGMGSYIDIVPRERSLFASAHVATDRLAKIVRRATRLPHAHVALELTLRPALVDLKAPLEGYSATLYLTAVAADPETAARRWEAALEDLVHLLREREWAVPP
ncbi:MAG TPA: hypothetical protein VKV02_09500, partial [Acidobacteriaceae bacterium]|nr:hypothetical protein [Acidobacteriaceae bacterium]